MGRGTVSCGILPFLATISVLLSMSEFARLVTGNLSPGQALAIEVMARNGTYDAAANAAGVNLSTLYRWRQEPEFMTALALAVEAEQRRIEEEEEADAKLRRKLALGALGAAKELAESDPNGKGYNALVTSKTLPKNVEVFDKMLDRSGRARRVARRMPTGDGPGIVNNVAAAAQANALATASASAQAAPPVVAATIREFIDRDLGPAVLPLSALYPRIEWILRQADRDDVRTVVLCLGKGSGKSIVAEVFLARQLQRILHHPDPAAAHRLLPGEKLGVLNLSVTGNQAQMSIFDGLSRLVRGSPWFKPHAPKDLSERIEFEGRNVVVLSGNSSSKGVEGISWVAAVADEVDRLPEAEGRGVARARDLVEPVEATMVTRFAAERKTLILSWPEHVAGYILQRVEQARKAGVREDLTADFRACPLARDPAEDVRRRAAIAAEPFREFAAEAFLAADGTLVVHAPTWELKPDADLGAFAELHRKSAFQFARMLGARPLRAGETPLVRDLEEFRRRANAKRAHPLDADGRFVEGFTGSPDFLYFAHIDVGVKHDAAGIAVAHYDEGRVVYDLLLEVKPPEGGEIRIKALRQILYDLERRSFVFGKVTQDGFEGISGRQDMEDHGIESEVFSVDRTRAAYETWLEAWHAGNLDYYPYEPLFECVQCLVDLGRKIDHVPGGKKDLTDAAAAVAFHVLTSVLGYS